MSLPEAVSPRAFEGAPELPRNSLEIIGPPRRKGPQRALTPNPPMADPLLTVEDVGHRLNVSKDWVWDHCWRKNPRLPVIRMGDGAPAMQFWLRPSVPYWGITKRVSEILTAVTRQFNEASEPTAISVRSVMAGDDRRHVPFRHVFNSVINMPTREFPSGLEMFLVPGHIAYVAVHTPIGSPEGYPVPLGVLSFDPEVVARAQASLAKIFATSFAVPYHLDWDAKDVVASVRAALQPESIVPIQTFSTRS